MSDDGFSLLEIVVGIGLLVLLLGLFAGMSGGIKPAQSMIPARAPAYTPVQLNSSDWNQIPAAERTAFGVTDKNKQIIMLITATRDRSGVCMPFIVEESPNEIETIGGMLENPKEAGFRTHLLLAAQASYALYPTGIGEPPEVLLVTVSNISDKPVLYDPGNFYFRQYQGAAIPIPKYRLFGEEKFMQGGVLAPGESIVGGVLVEDMLNFRHEFEFWYGHNYGIIKKF